MNRKAKGTGGERKLIHKFWDHGWAAFRCAGSGAIKYPVPDLIAGNNLRKIAIEAKVVGSDHKYFARKEIEDLVFFASRFGSEAWLAIKFDNRGWFFISPDDLEKTKTQYGASFALCERRGLSFEEMVGKNI
jgi:holliday junction resolvase Hjr